MTDDLRDNLIDALNKHGILASQLEDDLLLSVCIEGIDVTLKCIFGPTFPYTFPKIQILPESKAKLDPMPHINADNSICVYDEGIAIPNFTEPLQLTVDTILKAIDVLSKGIRKDNRWDFLDEFNAYWATKALKKANSFLSDLVKYGIIRFCFQDGKNDPILIAESDDRLKHIYQAINLKELSSSKIKTGILIPIDDGFESSIPKTDQDIVRLIQKHSSFSKEYNSFMQTHIDEAVLLLFAQITSRGAILSGWIHFGPGVPKGFRQGHVNLIAAFSLSKEKGIAVAIENCSQSRLFSRGSDGKEAIWNSVALIGCGSIGSMLADTFLLSGTTDFILNDNQILRYENIARHARGYWYEGLYKVQAVKYGLEKHNPNVKCQCFTNDAHIFLEQNADVLNSSDIIFVSVASFPIEHHICSLIKEGAIVKPVVILWVEPYALGGHALIIKKNQDLFEELFDKATFEFRYPLISDASTLLKREAGCQSTYMPYSGFYLQMFISSIIEKIMTDTFQKKGNYLLSWCGKLSAHAEYGVHLTSLAMSASDFTFIERRVD